MAGLWARLQADLNVKLRRGAWYRIARLDPLRAVLEVGGRLLEIPSAFLQVIERPPRRWSVVPSLGRAMLCASPRAAPTATQSVRAVVSDNRSRDGRAACPAGGAVRSSTWPGRKLA